MEKVVESHGIRRTKEIVHPLIIVCLIKFLSCSLALVFSQFKQVP